MKSQIDPQTTVGALVAERPSRSRVFEGFKIDYCCGGKLPLAQACAKRGVPVAEVLDQLQHHEAIADDQTAVDAGKMTLTELTEHIEHTHHAYVHSELPRLGAMVRKVAAVHGDRYPWLLEVNSVYAALATELTSHMMKEEQILFPWIRDMESGNAGVKHACAASVTKPIEVMEHEHDDAGAFLQRLRELTSDYTPPADACNTFRAMLDGLSQLERDMHQHVHKENNILFPKAIALERSAFGKPCCS